MVYIAVIRIEAPEHVLVETNLKELFESQAIRRLVTDRGDGKIEVVSVTES